MTFWTPPSKFQTESNTNPYRFMTMEQMRQNYHNSLTEKMVSPDQLKMLRKEVSEYLQFAKGGGDYQSNKKQLESFVSAVGTGNMKKAKEVFERMNDELQDVIPQQIFKMLGESHLGPEYKYLGKDKKFGREFYEKGGQLFVTKGTGKFVQNLGSIEVKSNQKMIKGLVKESTELEEASIKVGDTVHLGHGTKGGTGVIGKVVKIEGGMVHIENEKGDTFKGPMSRATLKENVQLDEAHYATMEFMSRMAKRDPQDFIDYIKMKKMGEAEVFQKRGINFLRVRVRMPDHMGELNKVAGGFGFYAGDVVNESAEINEWWEDQVNKRSRGWKNGKVAANFQTYNAAGRTVNFKKGDDIYYHPYDMKGQSRDYKLVIAAEDPRKEGTYFAVNPKHLGLKGFDNATGPANESVEMNEEKFTSAQLAKLKQEYGKLKTVDPGSPTYSKLTNFLDGLSTEQLQQMVDARIPFLKGLALNRINRRKKDK